MNWNEKDSLALFAEFACDITIVISSNKKTLKAIVNRSFATKSGGGLYVYDVPTIDALVMQRDIKNYSLAQLKKATFEIENDKFRFIDKTTKDNFTTNLALKK